MFWTRRKPPDGEQFNYDSHGKYGVIGWLLLLVCLALVATTQEHSVTSVLLLCMQPLGLLIVCACSGYYHLNPNDETLRVDIMGISAGISLTAISHISMLEVTDRPWLILPVLLLSGIVVWWEDRRPSGEGAVWSQLALVAQALITMAALLPFHWERPDCWLWCGMSCLSIGFVFLLMDEFLRQEWGHKVWHALVHVTGVCLYAPNLLLALRA